MMGCLAFGAVAVGANQWEMLVERRNPEHKLVAVAAVYQKVVPESKEARPYRLGIAFQNQAPFPMMFEVTSIESSLGNVTIDGPTRASLRKLNQRAFLAPGQGITRWDGAIDTATLGEAAGGTISVTVNYGRRGKRRTYILTKSYTIYLGWTEAQLPFEWYHNDD
jgi:hypothetical protein